jgi:predicted permease
VRASIVAAGSLAGRGSGESPRLRLGRGLLVCQMALSLALVFAALLFVQSLRRLEHVDPGFDPRNLVLFRADPLLNGYEPARVLQYWRDGLDRIRRLPGVTYATITTHPLIANSSSSSSTYVKAPDGTQREVSVYRMSVGDDFFPTMGIPIRAGRAIETRDAGSGLFVAVINETMAREVFGQAAPLGDRFRLSRRPGAPEYEVVGVAADARYNTLRRRQPSIAYLSLAQAPSPGDITFYTRTAAGAADGAALKEAMRQVDATVPVFGLRTQEEQIARYLAQERFFASLGTALGAAALLLACIGLYGLLSYAVTRRTPELGVRLALGASPRGVASSIVKESLVLAAVGAALGLPAAYGLGRAAESTLFGVAATSPVLMAVATIVLAAVSAGAAFLPARRASRVDPLVALRAE